MYNEKFQNLKIAVKPKSHETYKKLSKNPLFFLNFTSIREIEGTITRGDFDP